MRNETSLLIAEPPLQVLPTLATAIGLREAIVIQQMYWLISSEKGEYIDGEQWINLTYEEWVERYFPFFTVDILKKLMISLQERFLVISCQPQGILSRKKYYRLNAGGINNLTIERFRGAKSHDEGAKSHVPDGADSHLPIYKENIREIYSGDKSSKPGGIIKIKPKPKLQKTPLSDEAHLAELKEEELYAPLNVEREWGKCRQWCKENRKNFSRRRVVNWLNTAMDRIPSKTVKRSESYL